MLSMKNHILEKKKGNFVGKFISSEHNYISPQRKGAVGHPFGVTSTLGHKVVSL